MLSVIDGGRLSIEEMLEKGKIIDFSKEAYGIGYIFPTYFSKKLDETLEPTEYEKYNGASKEQRLNDTLSILLFKIKGGQKNGGAIILYNVTLATYQGHTELSVKAVCHSLNAEVEKPAIFVMLQPEQLF